MFQLELMGHDADLTEGNSVQCEAFGTSFFLPLDVNIAFLIHSSTEIPCLDNNKETAY